VSPRRERDAALRASHARANREVAESKRSRFGGLFVLRNSARDASYGAVGGPNEVVRGHEGLVRAATGPRDTFVGPNQHGSGSSAVSSTGSSHTPAYRASLTPGRPWSEVDGER